MNKHFLRLSFSLFLISFGLMLLSFSYYRSAQAAQKDYNIEYTSHIVQSARNAAQPSWGDSLGDIVVYGNKIEPFVYAWDVKVYDQGWGNQLASETWVASEFETIKATAGVNCWSQQTTFQFTGNGRIGGTAGRGLVDSSTDGLKREYEVTYRNPSLLYGTCTTAKTAWVAEDASLNDFQNLANGCAVSGKSYTCPNKAYDALLELNNHFNPSKWVVKGTVN
ncbi:MAG: hypothetical protein WCV58_02240 [Patescibacteria group bacterium]